MSNFKLFIRNLIKAILQFCILPLVYIFYKNRTIQENLVIFADSKNNGIPYSMLAMYETVKHTNKYEIKVLCIDYSKLSILEKVEAIIEFMKLYANAKYVFICDYFLPVSSCKKRKETKVIQLWHSSGLQKKFGYDAIDDLGNIFFCKPTKNFDLVSVSSEFIKKYFVEAWKLNNENVKAFGTSRTDILFDEKYKEFCINNFYKIYPEAKNKKIILWAPTFRGNANDGKLVGIDDILEISKKMSDKYYFIIKLHPHLKEKSLYDNCSLNTENLYFVADILITDYSSIMNDFLLLNKKIILYIPDYDSYILRRGLYVDYFSEFKFPIIKNKKILSDFFLNDINSIEKNPNFENYKMKYLAANDGLASKRILNYLLTNKLEV